MHIHCLQHVYFETPGSILDWIVKNNHTISYTYFFEENPNLPHLDSFDALIILGGYMNVYEEEIHPWLKAEKVFIKKAIEANKKILGICLGSQLLAVSLGAKVYRGSEKEIGFFSISLSNEAKSSLLFNHFQNEATVFHWHGDTFEIPENAIRIASSDAFLNQGFMVGNQILAFQFHIEMNEEIIESLIINEQEELSESGNYIQKAELIRANYKILEHTKKVFFTLLDKFLPNELQ
jgi:GMP synthase-like glutamine amidotransferase